MNRYNHIEETWLPLILDELRGELSISEQQELKAWLSSSAENKKYYDELKQLWLTLEVRDNAQMYDCEKAFQKFQHHIGKDKKARNRVSVLSFLKYAAVMMLILVSGYLTYLTQFSTSDLDDFALNSISVPKGSTSKVEFKDGSKIWINSGSEIALSEEKNKKERRIKLEGEAFLEVARNEKAPFVVETDHVNVQVLGTTFNVNAYADNKEVKVTLETGSVELILDSGEKHLLTPNEQVVYDVESKKSEVRTVDLKEVVAWKVNSLIFTGEMFSDIIVVLQNKFQVEIDVKKKGLLNSRFRGDFMNGETLEQILSVMSSGNRFRYSIKEDKVHIY